MRKITISLFCSFSALFACSQEKASSGNALEEKVLQDKVDVFMTQHRAPIYAFVNDNAAVEALKNDPFLVDFKQFTKDNGNTYATLRKARYAQYAPPPAGLQSLSWQTGGDWGDNLDLLNIVFSRSFEPAFPAQFVYGLAIPRLTAMTNATIEETTAYYKAKTGYGTLIYTKPVSDSSYQIWAADNIFAITFKINVYTSTLSDIRFNLPKDPAYANVKWTPSLVKGLDEATRLQGDINQGIWNKTTTVNDFYSKNINRFKKAREERLQLFVKDYSPAATGYKELEQVAEHIQQDTLSRTYIYPEQWEVGIQSASLSGDNARDMALRLQLNGFFGSARYVKQLDKDNWEVWVVNEKDRIYYVWNTYTGKIDKARYWIKE